MVALETCAVENGKFNEDFIFALILFDLFFFFLGEGLHSIESDSDMMWSKSHFEDMMRSKSLITMGRNRKKNTE